MIILEGYRLIRFISFMLCLALILKFFYFLFALILKKQQKILGKIKNLGLKVIGFQEERNRFYFIESIFVISLTN